MSCRNNKYIVKIPKYRHFPTQISSTFVHVQCTQITQRRAIIVNNYILCVCSGSADQSLISFHTKCSQTPGCRARNSRAPLVCGAAGELQVSRVRFPVSGDEPTNKTRPRLEKERKVENKKFFSSSHQVLQPTVTVAP